MSGEAKVALITGGSSGIGAATAKLLAKKGYKVAITGTKQEKIDLSVKECADASPNKLQPLGLKLDFSLPENGELAVKQTVEHFGRLDVLVNNAGTFIKTMGSDSESYQNYRRLMSVNIDSTVQATLLAVEHLKKTNGNVIFVSSVASVKGTAGGYAYSMSKAAMTAFARCLAIDLAPSIRFNVVSPGPVATSIFENLGMSDELTSKLMAPTTLLNRIGKSEEIANVIGFLVSDEASFVNGQEMFVDGGYTLKQANSLATRIREARESGELALGQK